MTEPVPHIPTIGSVQQIMPAVGDVAITFDNDTIKYPLIGYAVVVSYVDQFEPNEPFKVETVVEPLILNSKGCPVTMQELGDYYSSHFEWRVIR